MIPAEPPISCGGNGFENIFDETVHLDAPDVDSNWRLRGGISCGDERVVHL
jgi:hypothetical protein